MRTQFELFVRCVGLGLVTAGILLGLEIIAAWLQPVPDLGAFRKSRESVVPGGKAFPEDFGIWTVLEATQTRGLLLRLLTRGVVPVALGLFLLRFAEEIAARYYPAWRDRVEQPTSFPKPAMAPTASGELTKPGPEKEDRKYAPPGYPV